MREFRETCKEILFFLTDRLIITLIAFGIFTYALLGRLFEMQIVDSDAYQGDLKKTDTAELPVLASRGEIFDRYGRPLAINVTTYTIKLNPSAPFDRAKLNNNLYDLLALFKANGETYIDELPISKDEPYTLLFSGSETREARWRSDMNISDDSITGAQVFAELREKFGIDPELTNAEARELVSLRSAIYMKRYQKYNPITLAVRASEKTMAIIEEESEKYTGVFVEPDYMREYPGGITFSHIIG
jgi:penicillin-binding protein 2